MEDQTHLTLGKHTHTHKKKNDPSIMGKKDETKQNKTQQNKTKQNKNKTKQNKTKQNKTKQNKTKQNKNKTKQNKTKQNKTKQNKTKQNKTKQNKTKQNKAKQKQRKTREKKKREKKSPQTPSLHERSETPQEHWIGMIGNHRRQTHCPEPSSQLRSTLPVTGTLTVGWVVKNRYVYGAAQTLT